MSLEKKYDEILKETFDSILHGNVTEWKRIPYLNIEKRLAYFIQSLENIAIKLEQEDMHRESSFELNLIQRLDQLTLLMEEFINTNKNLVKNLEMLNVNPVEKEREFREEEIIEIQELSDEVIKQIILDYVKKHKKETVYPSDIAFAFNLDTEIVYNICQKLIEEGKLVD